MDRQALAREAEAAARRARHNLRWIRKHPDRIDQAKLADMEAYLERMIRFAEEEKRNARRAGRTFWKMHFGKLFVSIIPRFHRERERHV
ncbi:MAG: hypothetical protein C6W55_10480 [Thermobacillus sp.]|uniref:hypothetical protein n=1 Tax=Thermobacillus sp. TaxID=2108467 RepID=UPI000E39FE00|nr:hypothetical protein [Thermobacillus sp.]REK54747.1 MAG: hypothetical protein C6W55_10480 [Thermobacillus sp.]